MPKPAAPLPDFIVHCLELLAPLGAMRARRLFGGYGIDLDGLTVAIVADDQLYMKADAQSAPRWQAAGGRAFSAEMRRNGTRRTVSMSYWSPPGEAMESPAQMRPWARLALDAALRARAAKPASRPKASRPTKKKAG